MNTFAKYRVTAAVLATLVCGAALADAFPDPSQTVSYGDLNLKSQAGVATLYQRIKKAAYEVCQIPVGTHQIRIEQEFKACKADAVDRAVGQVNLPLLTTLHESKTGRKVDGQQFADRR